MVDFKKLLAQFQNETAEERAARHERIYEEWKERMSEQQHDNTNEGAFWSVAKAVSGKCNYLGRDWNAAIVPTGLTGGNAPTHRLFMCARDQSNDALAVALWKSLPGEQKFPEALQGKAAMTLSGQTDTHWVNGVSWIERTERAPAIKLTFKEKAPQAAAPAPQEGQPQQAASFPGQPAQPQVGDPL